MVSIHIYTNIFIFMFIFHFHLYLYIILSRFSLLASALHSSIHIPSLLLYKINFHTMKIQGHFYPWLSLLNSFFLPAWFSAPKSSDVSFYLSTSFCTSSSRKPFLTVCFIEQLILQASLAWVTSSQHSSYFWLRVWFWASYLH